MPLPEPEANPLAGRIFEEDVAAIQRKMAQSKSADKKKFFANQIAALVAAANFEESLTEAEDELARGKMVEQRRRESEVELVLEEIKNVAYSFPDDYLHQVMSPRFFELLADAARSIVAATKEFHPVSFRAFLNDSWRFIGRAEEVAWSMERAHESGHVSGTKAASMGANALRAAILEGTATGTIEVMAERHNMEPRNVLFIKASIRKRQAI